MQRVGKGQSILIAFVVVVSLMLLASSNAVVSQEVLVKIKVDGKVRQLAVPLGTVENALKSVGLEIGNDDKVYPGLEAQVFSGMYIEVVRVEIKVIKSTETIPFKTILKPSRGLGKGRTKLLCKGASGKLEKVWKVTYEDGVEKAKELVNSEVLSQPKDEIRQVGITGNIPARGYWTVRRSLDMVATAYSPGRRCCGRFANGRTSIGLRAGYGVVAVDPKVIALKMKLFIEGYGYAIAGDVGRAIKGKCIDLGFNSYGEARRLGRKKVKVHIIE